MKRACLQKILQYVKTWYMVHGKTPYDRAQQSRNRVQGHGQLLSVYQYFTNSSNTERIIAAICRYPCP